MTSGSAFQAVFINGSEKQRCMYLHKIKYWNFTNFISEFPYLKCTGLQCKMVHEVLCLDFLP